MTKVITTAIYKQKVITEDNVCDCSCHVVGVGCMHMMPCCCLCYDKYLVRNDAGQITVDSDMLQAACDKAVEYNRKRTAEREARKNEMH